jgi:hypothetical protein
MDAATHLASTYEGHHIRYISSRRVVQLQPLLSKSNAKRVGIYGISARVSQRALYSESLSLPRLLQVDD